MNSFSKSCWSRSLWKRQKIWGVLSWEIFLIELTRICSGTQDLGEWPLGRHRGWLVREHPELTFNWPSIYKLIAGRTGEVKVPSIPRNIVGKWIPLSPETLKSMRNKYGKRELKRGAGFCLLPDRQHEGRCEEKVELGLSSLQWITASLPRSLNLIWKWEE